MVQRYMALLSGAETVESQLKGAPFSCLCLFKPHWHCCRLPQMVQRYEALSSGAETVESQLKGALVEYLNAEMTLGAVRDVPQAVAWMQTSFLFVRVRHRPSELRLRRKMRICAYWTAWSTSCRRHAGSRFYHQQGKGCA